jgi:hypothetical protein
MHREWDWRVQDALANVRPMRVEEHFVAHSDNLKCNTEKWTKTNSNVSEKQTERESLQNCLCFVKKAGSVLNHVDEKWILISSRFWISGPHASN